MVRACTVSSLMMMELASSNTKCSRRMRTARDASSMHAKLAKAGTVAIVSSPAIGARVAAASTV
jgi:hypothetical protein